MVKIYQELSLTWIEVDDQSEEANCSANREIRIKTPMLRSDLCDFPELLLLKNM